MSTQTSHHTNKPHMSTQTSHHTNNKPPIFQVNVLAWICMNALVSFLFIGFTFEKTVTVVRFIHHNVIV